VEWHLATPILAPKLSNKGSVAGKVSWGAFAAFQGVWAMLSSLILDEELGILHWSGMQPITTVALHDWRVMAGILLLGPNFTAWWLVHLYRRKYGDLAGK
jgi:hypothetical protein